VNGARWTGLALALAVAGFVWVRDVAWLSAASDALPALVAFPLAVWLGRPWHWRPDARPARPAVFAGAIALFILGAALDLTLLLAIGWSIGLVGWLRPQLQRDADPGLRGLGVLLVCGFPWIVLDGQALGWWFRFSGAAASEVFFRGMALDVIREGTLLRVEGLPLSVDPACSGLNALQAMLVAGVGLACVLLRGPRFWIGVALLLPLAWLANTARIIFLGFIGLSFGAEAAAGWFHAWGGWSVLCGMFGLCLVVFRLLGAPATKAA
jgi:exosortase/archaeosortase family protein